MLCYLAVSTLGTVSFLLLSVYMCTRATQPSGCTYATPSHCGCVRGKPLNSIHLSAIARTCAIAASLAISAKIPSYPIHRARPTIVSFSTVRVQSTFSPALPIGVSPYVSVSHVRVRWDCYTGQPLNSETLNL